MAKLKIPFDKELGYSLRLGSKPFYFKQLQAEIMFQGRNIGVSFYIFNNNIAYGDITPRRLRSKRMGMDLPSFSL